VCSSAQRTAKNLRFVSQALRRESLVSQDFIATEPVSCESLQKDWKEWTDLWSSKNSREDRFVFVNAIKGCKTLFDEPCRRVGNKNCDFRARLKAEELWCAKALDRGSGRPGKPGRTEPAVLDDIRRRTRRIIGRRWFRERRGVYVPDQQGCYEMERGCGGTLSVPKDASLAEERRIQEIYDRLGIDPEARGGLNLAFECGQAIPEESAEATRCRLGAAKQKGKVRIVTMQTAIMKDVLRPVHESAYLRLSQKPWLVRGDVTKDHFESLRRTLHRGHDFISGDYEASTDNLHKDAVLAVVETLAQDLPPRESELFVRSFRDCAVSVEENGVTQHHPVVRGSMMGNLGSFVVLCILNRICFERALQLSGYSPDHASLINGDDILYTGESGLYHSWLHSTSEVGFVINVKKTMRSRKYGDLNSQTYNYGRSRMVKKLCFGFLASDSWKEPVGTLARPLFDLCKQLNFATAAWLLTAFPVRQLLVRVPIPLSSIPRRWWAFLVKKNWFRGLIDRSDEPRVVKTGYPRALPFVLGPPIHSTPYLECRIRDLGDKFISSSVNEWSGVPVPPEKQTIPHRKFPKLRSRFRLGRQCHAWKRLWLKPVLELVTEQCPDILVSGCPDWVDEQPGLQVHYRVTRSPLRRPFSFAPPSSYSAQGSVYQSEVVPTLSIQGTVLVWQ
jgi:hypothetical protein